MVGKRPEGIQIVGTTFRRSLESYKEEYGQGQ